MFRLVDFKMSTEQTLDRPQEINEQGRILEIAIEAAAKGIINIKDTLDEWDSKVGDGDCGSTVCSFYFSFIMLMFKQSVFYTLFLEHNLYVLFSYLEEQQLFLRI